MLNTPHASAFSVKTVCPYYFVKKKIFLLWGIVTKKDLETKKEFNLCKDRYDILCEKQLLNSIYKKV
jgi:hypothetical protein